MTHIDHTAGQDRSSPYARLLYEAYSAECVELDFSHLLVKGVGYALAHPPQDDPSIRLPLWAVLEAHGAPKGLL